ncbi:hypothetical protein PDJAM_G00122570 [Pangasius djambal]|uniref:Uncharacterized protein n=1 Tax=Pangasius djambal TaxID=1691987 RepID=A0ACC5ZAJ5_9TELE|nr:hypothetical protein [Pangasius djambal]
MENEYEVTLGYFAGWFRYFLFSIWVLEVVLIWILTYLEINLIRKIRNVCRISGCRCHKLHFPESTDFNDLQTLPP